MEPLLQPERFKLYRQFRRANPHVHYTEPFVPCVGPAYDSGELIKFVFCGAAIWERELVSYDCADDDAHSRSQRFTEGFLNDVGQGWLPSAFWRLFAAASAVLQGETVPLRKRVDASVWTNLSKLGQAGESEPLNGEELIDLDTAQLQIEFARLNPEVVLCVSGEMLTDTGNRFFSQFARIEGATPRTRGSIVKRLPNGGVLLWTNHPQWKPKAWFDTMLADIQQAKGLAAHRH